MASAFDWLAIMALPIMLVVIYMRANDIPTRIIFKQLPDHSSLFTNVFITCSKIILNTEVVSIYSASMCIYRCGR